MRVEYVGKMGRLRFFHCCLGFKIFFFLKKKSNPRQPQNASPHHVVFIADPQLVDPHTYPGRPWPLSSLTVFYSDLYLYRTHSLLQQELRPDTTFFLGDLFDGGREWGSSKPEPRFEGYGSKIWMKEYRRFVKLFIDTWRRSGVGSTVTSRGRKIIASLPGNHDLGFGNGIQKNVVDRFQMYFGPGNRVDVLGNHTFVSVDTVSLSAREQPDPDTGASSAGQADTGSRLEEIWKPAEDFLTTLKSKKAHAITDELRAHKGQSENYKLPHEVVSASTPVKPTVSPEVTEAEFPTIMLTHVPLYREAGTPCGPLREQYPPSSVDPLPEGKDERNAIKIHHGYQYQNVLTQTISRDLVTKAGPDVTHIYSGDDHDYCEINHREYSGSPKEITVKSISLAMGVRRPAFQMASLWNPVDVDTGKSTYATKPSATVQNHLCLQPDQVSIFVQYAYILVLTLLILIVRAISVSFRSSSSSSETTSTMGEPLLPVSNKNVSENGLPQQAAATMSSSSTSSASTSFNQSRFANRGFTSATSRRTSGSLSSSFYENNNNNNNNTGSSNNNNHNNNYGNAHIQSAGGGGGGADEMLEKSGDFSPKGGISSNDNTTEIIPRRGRVYRAIDVFRHEFVKPLKRVALVAFAWYLLLVWTW